jgi:hypothetical protein
MGIVYSVLGERQNGGTVCIIAIVAVLI